MIAPIGGRVGRAIVTEGNLVSSGPGEATLLTTLVSLDPIYASFEVDEQSFLAFQRLRRARARGARSAGGGHPHGAGRRGGLPARGPAAVPRQPARSGTGTIRVRAVFANADGALTPGLFVRLRLSGGKPYPAVLVQDQAVGTDLDKRFVYVVGR